MFLKYTKLAWNWKYRNHAICFLFGSLLMYLILTYNNNRKTTKLELDYAILQGQKEILIKNTTEREKITVALQSKIDSMAQVIIENKIKTDNNNNSAHETYNDIFNYSDADAQEYFTRNYGSGKSRFYQVLFE